MLFFKDQEVAINGFLPVDKWPNPEIKQYNIGLSPSLCQLQINNYVKLLAIAEFVYNIAKNTSTGYKLFKLNYGFLPYIFYKKNIDFCSKSKTAEKLVAE